MLMKWNGFVSSLGCFGSKAWKSGIPGVLALLAACGMANVESSVVVHLYSSGRLSSVCGLDVRTGDFTSSAKTDQQAVYREE
jgi:hypothetical protein